MCFGMCGPWVCFGMWEWDWVCAGVWDEFSEYLLETRVLTSVDFDTYPIRILNQEITLKKVLRERVL